MVVTPVKYLSGHKEGPSKNDAYASTKAVNLSALGRQWEHLSDYDPVKKSVLLKFTLKI